MSTSQEAGTTVDEAPTASRRPSVRAKGKREGSSAAGPERTAIGRRQQQARSAPLPVYRSGPVRAIAVPVLYVVMIVLVLVEFPALHLESYATALVIGALVVYLLRELSVFYTIDEEALHAWRLFGWRSISLESIHKIEPVSLRDLAPVGFSGTWGWRSRLWSAQLNSSFEAIQTHHRGLIIHGEGVPLFISPRDRDAFAHALYERVQLVNPSIEAPAPSAAPS